MDNSFNRQKSYCTDRVLVTSETGIFIGLYQNIDRRINFKDEREYLPVIKTKRKNTNNIKC
jgi:hypothetical protein